MRRPFPSHAIGSRAGARDKTLEKIEMRPPLKLALGVIGLGLLVARTAPTFAQEDSVMRSTAEVDQIPGNIAIVKQSGSANTAIAEQEAILGAGYANAASILQYGAGGNASITQKNGSQLAAGIAQYGANETATVTQQNGTNLGVQIFQYSNGASIGVTQSGAGAPNGPPIVIKQF